MGYWLVLRDRMGVRDWEGIFKNKEEAETHSKIEDNNRSDVEYWPVIGDDKVSDKI
jgi:hypothetical protein